MKALVSLLLAAAVAGCAGLPASQALPPTVAYSAPLRAQTETSGFPVIHLYVDTLASVSQDAIFVVRGTETCMPYAPNAAIVKIPGSVLPYPTEQDLKPQKVSPACTSVFLTASAYNILYKAWDSNIQIDDTGSVSRMENGLDAGSWLVRELDGSVDFHYRASTNPHNWCTYCAGKRSR